MSGAEGARSVGWPVGVLGALAMVALTELVVFAPRSMLGTLVPASWSVASQDASREALGRDVLFLGDSQIKGSLLPRVVEQRFAGSTHNLAVIGGQPASSYYLLEAAIRAGARPRAIVVGSYSGLLTSSARIHVRHWPELLDGWQLADLIRNTRDPRLAGPVLLQSLIPSYRRRDEIREAAWARITSVDAPQLDKARAYRRNWRVNGGGQALSLNESYRDESIAAAQDGPGDVRRWKVRPEHVDYLRRLLAMARSRGIRVFWLLPTNSPALLAQQTRTGVEGAYTAFLRRLQADFPELIVLDPRSVTTDPTEFSDPCHLDHRGAIAVSLAVAETLNACLGSPDTSLPAACWITLAPPLAEERWVHLARVETFDQSLVRVSGNAMVEEIAGAEAPVRR